MHIALIVIIVAVLLARLDIKNKTNKNYGLISAFVLLTVFVSIRYNWGSDYPGYLNFFLTINSYSNIDMNYYREAIGGMEYGWVFLNRLFKPIGFFGMIIVLTCLEYAIIYRFIVKYLDRKHYWLAVLLFGMTFGLMITGVSMMRQFLAQCLCLIAFEYVIKKKLLFALVLGLFATAFHKSAMILLPIYFVGYYYNIIKNKIVSIFVIVLLSVLYLFGRFLLEGVIDTAMLLSEDFQRYEVYIGQKQFEHGIFGYLQTIYDLILIVITIFIGRKFLEREKLILIVIFCCNFLMDAFAKVVPMIDRLGLYFTMVGIVVLPMIFSSIKDKLWRTLIPLSYVLRITYGFISAFYSDIWYDSFFEYHTIFEASHWM